MTSGPGSGAAVRTSSADRPDYPPLPTLCCATANCQFGPTRDPRTAIKSARFCAYYEQPLWACFPVRREGRSFSQNCQRDAAKSHLILLQGRPSVSPKNRSAFILLQMRAASAVILSLTLIATTGQAADQSVKGAGNQAAQRLAGRSPLITSAFALITQRLPRINDSALRSATFDAPATSDPSWLNPTPHAIAVYASQPSSPMDLRNTRYQADATPYLLPAGSHQLRPGALIRSPRRRGRAA
jgi:hypothetical protein